MICPKCGEDNNFVRRTEDNFMRDEIVRHRFCAKCTHEFVTVEKTSKSIKSNHRRMYGKKH